MEGLTGGKGGRALMVVKGGSPVVSSVESLPARWKRVNQCMRSLRAVWVKVKVKVIGVKVIGTKEKARVK